MIKQEMPSYIKEITKATLESEIKILEQIANLEKIIFKDTAYSLYSLKKIIENYVTYKIFYYQEENSQELQGYNIVLDSIDCYEILKIAVVDKHRRKGVAERLLIPIKDRDIFLEVRESNQKAISFYLKNNFNKIAIRKNYYKDNNENALIMKMEANN